MSQNKCSSTGRCLNYPVKCDECVHKFHLGDYLKYPRQKVAPVEYSVCPDCKKKGVHLTSSWDTSGRGRMPVQPYLKCRYCGFCPKEK